MEIDLKSVRVNRVMLIVKLKLDLEELIAYDNRYSTVLEVQEICDKGFRRNKLLEGFYVLGVGHRNRAQKAACLGNPL